MLFSSFEAYSKAMDEFLQEVATAFNTKKPDEFVVVAGEGLKTLFISDDNKDYLMRYISENMNDPEKAIHLATVLMQIPAMSKELN